MVDELPGGPQFDKRGTYFYEDPSAMEMSISNIDIAFRVVHDKYNLLWPKRRR